MNNKTIVWVILGVAVVGGGLYWLASTPVDTAVAPTTTTTVPTNTQAQTTTKTPVVAPQTTTTQPTVAAPKVKGNGSISALFALKQSLVCSISNPVRSGTMYISAGAKMRGNFMGTTMIDDGKYLYAWSNGSSKGLKVLASGSASGSAIASNGGLDLSADFSYSCNAWVENADMFVPPGSVSF